MLSRKRSFNAARIRFFLTLIFVGSRFSRLTATCRITPILCGALPRRIRLSSSRNGRVAAGGYPPAAPTDPGVPDSSTRLLGLWIRYATVHTVHHAHLGEGIGLAQPAESLPPHPPAPRTPVQPLAPSPLDFVSEALQRLGVAGDSVIGIVTLQLAAQRRVLVSQAPMTMRPAPLAHSLSARLKRSLAVLRFTTHRPFLERPQ